MKFTMRLMAVALSCILLLSLVACTEKDSGPKEPDIPADEAYRIAKEQLLAAPNLVLTYSSTTTRLVNGHSYTETVSGTASYSDVGTEEMVAVIEENLTYNTMTAKNVLSFCNGRAYSRISGSIFGLDMTVEEFVAQQLPAALLDLSLYENLGRTVHDGGSLITFTQPTALEGWLDAPADAKIVSALGSASLDNAGVLKETQYEVIYLYGDVSYTTHVKIQCATPDLLDLTDQHPEHPEEYTMLSCLEAPKLLLRAAGDIFAANAISANATETIYSQIIPLTQQRVSAVSMTGSNETLYALLDNTITVTDYRDQPDTTTQCYKFTDGACYASTNGSDPAKQYNITAESMRNSIEDTLLSSLFATRYLAGATLTEVDGVYRLDFTGNEAYCTDLTQALSSFLNLPLDASTPHNSTIANGYLCIDKVTGLPVEMGMYFSRTHVIGEIPYKLSYQLDQTITFSVAK